MVMRSLTVFAVLAACGGPQQSTGGGSAEPIGVAQDTRTELEKRRDLACDALGPKLTQCAVEDARAELKAGKVSQKELDANTAPDIQAGLTKKWGDDCKVPVSSRQVRVLEVCFKEETECDPLLDCLGHLNAKSPR